MSEEESLRERLAFVGLNDAALARLKAVKPVVMAALPAALDRFYAKIMAEPATRGFFADQAMASGAKTRQATDSPPALEGRC